MVVADDRYLAEDWFVGGGAPLTKEQIFLHGQIRAGRSPEAKRSLLAGLIEVIASVAVMPKNSVWGYIVELPAAQMAEYGQILPKPGTEATWLRGLPAADRALMETTGK